MPLGQLLVVVFFHDLIIVVLVVFVFFSWSLLCLDADTVEGKLYSNVFCWICFCLLEVWIGMEHFCFPRPLARVLLSRLCKACVVLAKEDQWRRHFFLER